jgi:hypothetical protein
LTKSKSMSRSVDQALTVEQAQAHLKPNSGPN